MKKFLIEQPSQHRVVALNALAAMLPIIMLAAKVKESEMVVVSVKSLGYKLKPYDSLD